jgi:hypothetical protein
MRWDNDIFLPLLDVDISKDIRLVVAVVGKWNEAVKAVRRFSGRENTSLGRFPVRVTCRNAWDHLSEVRSRGLGSERDPRPERAVATGGRAARPRWRPRARWGPSAPALPRSGCPPPLGRPDPAVPIRKDLANGTKLTGSNGAFSLRPLRNGRIGTGGPKRALHWWPHWL